MPWLYAELGSNYVWILMRAATKGKKKLVTVGIKAVPYQLEY